MKYDIYFHNDLDGMASAAILFHFLKSREDKVLSFYPVDFFSVTRKKWAKLKFENPSAIVDFLHHPQAEIWFDHHPTTFIKPSWKKDFRHKKLNHWGVIYKSCARLIVESLKKDFNFRTPKYLKELTEWMDKVDGYYFKSIKESIDFKKPAVKLDLLISNFKLNNKIIAKIISTLSSSPLKNVLKIKELQPYLRRIEKEIKKSKKFYKTNIKVIKNVSFIDETQNEAISIRSLLYHLYPHTPYFIILHRERGGGKYAVTAGKNPWLKSINQAPIGEYLKKFNGGGHDKVGGAEFKTKNLALKASKEITQFLNNQYNKNNIKSKI
ncbi:MAG: hypothetical protein WC297_01945 [Candidatus Paceibacterota bacterium]|jgi:oligoribonuclease NrnB/cAMP/cGMP phosphodiesterase (DHH superfamily)